MSETLNAVSFVVRSVSKNGTTSDTLHSQRRSFVLLNQHTEQGVYVFNRSALSYVKILFRLVNFKFRPKRIYRY